MRTINLSQISFINRRINSSTELPDLLKEILNLAQELVKAEGSSLLLKEPDTNNLIFYIVMGKNTDLIKGEKVPIGTGIAGTVAKTGKPLIVNDVQKDVRFYSEIDYKSNYTTKNILCVPMNIKGTLVGVLEVVNSFMPQGFTRWDMQLLTYLADQAAIAISNRMLYDNLTSRIKELSALYEISQSISFATSSEDIFCKVIKSLANSFSIEKASIILHNKEEDILFLMASLGLPESIKIMSRIDSEKTIAGSVFNNGEPLLVSDIETELTIPFNNKETLYSTKSFISAPIRSKNQIYGVLNIADKLNRQNFNSNDLKFILTIGSQIGEIYQNILYQKEIEKQKVLSKEIEIASTIHKKLLPRIPEKFKHHEIAAFHKPAEEVGGDFYDFLKFDENKYATLVADISGKGISAALFMGAALNIMRAEARINNQPGTILKGSNKHITEDSESGMFVSLFYMLVDSHNNIFTYGNAGHNDQLFIKNKTKEIIKLNAKGTALGLNINSEYEEKIMLYEPGDIVILFTDGVLEYLGDGNIDKGEEILIDNSLKHIDYSPGEYIKIWENHIDKNFYKENYMDDFTILVLKF
ncbi:MAG: GAF domain-containing SpoIIE family protein phosphatase [Spirochaetota bacterium]|nr:GAF domain-containing SpoIIE family protein phosphatase [Spirochaetota bacterium]